MATDEIRLLRKGATEYAELPEDSGSDEGASGDAPPEPRRESPDMPMTASSHLRLLAKHWAVLKFFWCNFRVVMCVVWLSAFSGALQSPVVSFFLLQLGMTPVGIGRVGFITATGALFLGPIYGWLMDAQNPYAVVVLSTSLCGLGCLLRGIAVDPTMVYAAATVMMLGAPMEPMVMAYICRTQHAIDRAATVAGFLAQSSALSLVGKAAYPLWDAAVRDGLAIQDTMLRYRLVLASCIAPCVAGFVLLAALWTRQRRSLVSLTQATHANRQHRPAPVVFGLVASAIIFKQFAIITTNVLWPLYVPPRELLSNYPRRHNGTLSRCKQCCRLSGL
jgi:MFS family permease